MQLLMQKTAAGALIPTDDEALDGLRKLKAGQDVKVKVTRHRNVQFHRKWFALANFAFDYWEPPEIDDAKKKFSPEKSFDRFRKDLIILAGHYEATYRIDGSVRIEAKSISFARMGQDEFEKLYSATIDAILKHICPQYTDEQLRHVVDQALSFA